MRFPPDVNWIAARVLSKEIDFDPFWQLVARQSSEAVYWGLFGMDEACAPLESGGTEKP